MTLKTDLVKEAEELVEKLLAEATKVPDKFEDWDFDLWAHENGSAVDVWGKEKTLRKLHSLLKEKAVIKSILTDKDDSDSLGAYAILRRKIAQYEKKGWKLLDDCNNLDSAEAIVYQTKNA